MDDLIRVVVDDAAATAAFERIAASATRADASVNRLGTGTDRVSASFRNNATAAGQTASAANSATSAFDRLVASSESASTSLGRLWNTAAISAFATIVKSTWNALEDAASSYITRLTEVQQTISLLSAVDQSSVGDNYTYLIDLADKYGIRLSSLQDNYAKLAMASEGTALTTDKVRKIFEATSTAARVLHLKTSEVDLAFLAIVQMASKGTVSMEELRRQFAERIPGAIPALSRELGVATADLLKFIKTGDAAADKMLPYLATALERTYSPGLEKASTALDAQINRIDNSLRVFFKNVYDADGSTGPTAVIEALNEKLQQPEVAENLAKWVNQISESIEEFIRSITADEIQQGANTLLEILQAIGNAAIMAGKGIKWMTENMGLVAPILGALVGGFTGAAFGPQGAVIGAATGAIVAGAGYLAFKGSSGPSAGSKSIEGQRDAIQKLEAQNAKLEKEINTFSGNFILAMFDNKEAKKAKLAENKAMLDKMQSTLGESLISKTSVTDYGSDLPDLPAMGSGNLSAMIGGGKSAAKGRTGRTSVDPITREYQSLAKTLSTDVAKAYAEAAAAELNLNEAEEKFVEIQNQPVWKSLGSTRQAHIKNLIDTWSAQIKVNKEEERYQAYLKEDNLGKKFDAQVKSSQTAFDQAAAQKEQNDMIGLTKDQLLELDIVKREDAAVDADRRALLWDNIDLSGAIGDQYRAEAKSLRDLNVLKLENVELSKLQAEADKSKKQYEEFWSSFQEYANSAFTDIAENGAAAFKRIGDSLKKYVIQMLYEMTIKKWILNISGTGGGINGIAGSSGSLSTLASAYNAFTSAATASSGTAATSGSMTALGSAYAGNMSLANTGGSLYANATGTGIDGLLASNGAYGTGGSSSMAGAGYTAAGVAGGIYGGRAISNGYSAWGGSSGNSAVNTGTAIGAAVGSIFPVVGTAIGALLGGLVGGVVNAAFGRKLTDVGMIANVSGGDVTVSDYKKEKGGWFRSDKTTVGEVNTGYQANYFSQQVSNVQDSTAAMARALGFSSEAIDNYTGSVKLNLKGVKDSGEAQERMNTALKGFQDKLVSAIPGLNMTTKEFEELMASVQASVSAAGITGAGIGDIIAQGAIGKLTQEQVGEQLSEVIIGGIYKTIAAQAFQPVIDLMMSSMITPIFTAIMAGVPVAQAISQGAIDKIVESANKAAELLDILFNNEAFMASIQSFEDGINQIASSASSSASSIIGITQAVDASVDERIGLENQLLTLLGDSAQLRSKELEAISESNRALQLQIWSIEDAKTAMDSALATLGESIQAEKDSLNEQLTAANEAKSAIEDVFNLLTDSIRELKGEVASTASMQYNDAMQFIQNAATSATLPSADDLQNAIDSIRSNLDSRDFASQVERDRAYLDLTNLLENLNAVAIPALAGKETDISNIQSQIDSLDTQLELATKQVSALYGIDKSVKTVADAVNTLNATMSSYADAINSALGQVQLSGPTPISEAVQGYQASLLPDKSFTDGWYTPSEPSYEYSAKSSDSSWYVPDNPKATKTSNVDDEPNKQPKNSAAILEKLDRVAEAAEMNHLATARLDRRLSKVIREDVVMVGSI